jgi:hypothetical protein
MTTAIRLPDTDGPFMEWLRELPGTHLFHPVDGAWCPHCPVACYLRHLGAPAPSVDAVEYTADKDAQLPVYHMLPDWASVVVEVSDDDWQEQTRTASALLAALEAP